jgi:peptidoglycan hydrolase CwlO-like protein
MTMSPVEIERKVRQLDNDVQSIYTMLSAIQGTQERHTNRLRELAEKLDAVDGKIGTVDSKVGDLDGKIDTVDSKVGDLDGKIDTVDSKVGDLDSRMDGLGAKMDTVLELLRPGPTPSS